MISPPISPETMAVYRATARARQRQRRAAADARREQAWNVARLGAERLKSEFGATRVVVFGSLAEGTYFDERSDIDFAAWGTAHAAYLAALGMLMDIDPRFEVDFVRVEEAPPSLRERIEAEGVDL